MLCRKLIFSLAKRSHVNACARTMHVAWTSIENIRITSNDRLSQRCSALFNRSPNLEVAKRFKYKKSRNSKDEESEEEDDEIEDIPQDKDTKVMKAKVNSLRADLIIKSGLQIARNKVEVAFYESKIRVNGKKIFKKSIPLHIGDEVDLVRGPSPLNPDFLLVSRIEILSVNQVENGLSVKLRRNKSLLIENYNDAWEPVDK